MPVFDQARFLQRSSDDGDRRPARAEHHRDEFLRRRKIVRSHTILRHEQPTTTAAEEDRGASRDRARVAQTHFTFSSRRSHAFASFQSRLTVSADTRSTSAVSSTVSPPKNRNSTT